MRTVAPNSLRLLRSAGIALAAAFTLILSVAAIARASTPTYVELGGFETYLQHPSLLSFSVDGDLEGVRLRWSHWGAGFTIAHGSIYEREGYPTYSSTTVSGAIKLDHVRWCAGARYYTRAVFYPHAPLPFRAGPIRLFTPCNGG
jgi:hypothetical protein